MKSKLLLALLAVSLTGTVAAQVKPEDAIKFRQSGYGFMAWNMGRIKMNVEGTYNKDEVIKAATAIQAIANSGMGNNVLALEHAKEALRLEPSNYQYQSLVSRLENGGSWYRTQQTMYGGAPTINNDFCVKLCIANIMCNLCCGGGGFFCGSPYTYH